MADEIEMNTTEALKQINGLTKWLRPLEHIEKVLKFVGEREFELASLETQIINAKQRLQRLDADIVTAREKRTEAVTNLEERIAREKQELQQRFEEWRKQNAAEREKLDVELQQFRVDVETSKENLRTELAPLVLEVQNAKQALADFREKLQQNVQKAVSLVHDGD
jgi:hypothetical protein